MKTPAPWLYGFAVAVVLGIVASLFNSPAIYRLRVPLLLAAYVIATVLFFKLGVWPALALWWGIGLVFGLTHWSEKLRHARRSKGVEVKPPSLVSVVCGLFVWPIVLPLVLLGGFVVFELSEHIYSLQKKLRPNHVPHYRGIEGCKEAAILGDARAQCTLGGGYAIGDYGLPQDYVESAKWYRKAAEQNNYPAQLALGNCLAEGKGVEKNVVEGLMWISLSHRIAIQHGAGWFFRDAAYQASDRAQAQMTEQQIAEAWAMLDSSPL